MSKLLVFTLALIAVTISQALAAPAHNPSLRGADLSDTCLKSGFDEGSNFGGANAVLMCKSNSDFRNASFRGADLSGANLARSNLNGADVTGAAMLATSVAGADLRGVKGLDQKQLDQACGDTATKVPAHMSVHICL